MSCSENASTVAQEARTLFFGVPVSCFNVMMDKIAVKIPCLLAYGKAETYQNSSKLYEQIEAEVQGIRSYFDKHQYSFKGFAPEIVFYVFPIESIERLRNKERGFYAGLC